MRFVVCLLFLLAACSYPSSQHVHKVAAQDAEFRSFKLTVSDSTYKEAELEILLLFDQVKCYLNFYHYVLEDEDKIIVTLLFDDKKIQENAYLLKGGQKLLLNKTMTDELISALKQGKKISIIHNKCEIIIEGHKFEKILQKI